MRMLETLALLGAWCLWRPMGWVAPGAVLARTLGSSDETNRTLAGVLLVRGGEHAVAPLQRNLAADHALPLSLRVLGDVGGAAALAAIKKFQVSADANVARAAADALRAATRARNIPAN
jgi:hypothetical protein